MLLLLAISLFLQVEFTPADTKEAIADAAYSTGVSYGWLYSTVSCETGGTFNPYVIGKLGELGAAQLYKYGELPRFYAYGFDNPFNPYQAVKYMALRFKIGRSGAWSCA